MELWARRRSIPRKPDRWTGRRRAPIQAGLVTLPEDQRIAVVLSDVHGYPYEEIAEIMNSSLGTVKSRISRGRARLRDYLRSQGELPSGVEHLAERDQSNDPSPARSQL